MKVIKRAAAVIGAAAAIGTGLAVANPVSASAACYLTPSPIGWYTYCDPPNPGCRVGRPC